MDDELVMQPQRAQSGSLRSLRDSGFPITQRPLRLQAQASLELSVAMFLAFLLLLGMLKFMLWMSERLVVRQRNYEATRATATQIPQLPRDYGWTFPIKWNEPEEKLDFFRRR